MKGDVPEKKPQTPRVKLKLAHQKGSAPTPKRVRVREVKLRNLRWPDGLTRLQYVK